MAERIHDDEPDVSEPVVRELLRSECPQWDDAPLHYLATSGTDNAMWRISVDDDRDVVVRLPRRPGAAAGVAREVAVLRALQQSAVGWSIETPLVRHLGQPHERFPFSWTVLQWIEGEDAWAARDRLDDSAGDALAADMAGLVTAIGESRPGVDLRTRAAGDRGGPLEPLLDRLSGWLDDRRPTRDLSLRT